MLFLHWAAFSLPRGAQPLHPCSQGKLELAACLLGKATKGVENARQNMLAPNSSPWMGGARLGWGLTSLGITSPTWGRTDRYLHQAVYIFVLMSLLLALFQLFPR